MKILTQEFFVRGTVAVARDLIGKYLVRNSGGKTRTLMITEVEAYDGPHDKACHGWRGKTPRTEIMFGPAGFFYIYFVYGMHWMLNIVTGSEGYPAAVLIRGAGDISGPGRLTKFLEIDKWLNGKPVAVESGLWVTDAPATYRADKILRTPRIGVDYAGPVWSKKPYRFLLSK